MCFFYIKKLDFPSLRYLEIFEDCNRFVLEEMVIDVYIRLEFIYHVVLFLFL